MTDAPKVGRPTEYSRDVANLICDRLARGESLRAICDDETLPSRETVRRWLTADPDFRGQYAGAREDQAETIADEILEIADDARNDWMKRHGEDDAGWQANGEHIQRSRLRIDARKWMASKLAPKKYGEKVQTEISGPGGGPVQTVDLSQVSDAALRELLAVADAQAGKTSGD